MTLAFARPMASPATTASPRPRIGVIRLTVTRARVTRQPIVSEGAPPATAPVNRTWPAHGARTAAVGAARSRSTRRPPA